MLESIIATAVILLILSAAALYIYNAKKKGKRCIGCPHGGKCSECSAVKDKK